MITLNTNPSTASVEAVIKDPEIFGRIAEDGHDLESYKITHNESQCFFTLESEGAVIGVWILYPANKSTLNIHCNILKEHREHGKEAGRLILEWFVNNAASNYKKLNAEIPVIYPEVYHYTRAYGFKDEGINRASIMKGGALVDQFRLGLTRDEAAKYLEI